jgi:biopolymer transport protein TolR
MGAQMNQGGGIRPGLTRKRYRPVSEINVTPFVDVMLVLLIVFMVTAPLLALGVDVNLPKTKATAVTDAVEPIAIEVGADGSLQLDDEPMDLAQLIATATAIREANPDIFVHIYGDQSAGYGAVMVVLGELKDAGFTKFTLRSLEARTVE